MKKLNKTLLIALCALTTAFSAVACGGGGNSASNSSAGEVSSDSSVDSSGDESYSDSSNDGSDSESTSDSSNDSSGDSSSENKPNLFDVSISASEGLAVDGDTSATVDEAYSFSVSVVTGYQKTEAFSVTATMGGEAVTLVEKDGSYTIEKVTGAIVITVIGAEIQTFNVTTSFVDGVTVEAAETVTYGAAYEFGVSIVTGYQKTEEFSVTATMGGEAVALVEDDGSYTIEKVTGDVVITVVGVAKKTFNVTKTETVGVAFNGADTVVFGESYSFTVSFTAG